MNEKQKAENLRRIQELIQKRARTPHDQQQAINNELSLLYHARYSTRKDSKYYY